VAPGRILMDWVVSRHPLNRLSESWGILYHLGQLTVPYRDTNQTDRNEDQNARNADYQRRNGD